MFVFIDFSGESGRNSLKWRCVSYFVEFVMGNAKKHRDIYRIYDTNMIGYDDTPVSKKLRYGYDKDLLLYI